MTPAYSSQPCSAAPLADSATPFRACYAVEAVIAAIGLILLLPLLLLVGAALCVLSRRGPLVTHERVGRYGQTFRMLKFRTMWVAGGERSAIFAIEAVGGSVPGRKSASDVRVTSWFAAFCRRFSLDELPQLWHVVRGEMSLVGPRPLTAVELEEHYGTDAPEVLQLRPGLTGLWQTMGRNRLTYSQRRRLDLLLVRRASTGLYLRILLLSIPRILSGAGAC